MKEHDIYIIIMSYIITNPFTRAVNTRKKAQTRQRKRTARRRTRRRAGRRGMSGRRIIK
jgi:hypothetical protein